MKFHMRVKAGEVYFWQYSVSLYNLKLEMEEGCRGGRTKEKQR